MMEKVVIVTGAGRGLARRVALDFAAHGSRVAVVDLVAERAKSTTKEIEGAGGTALSLVCDVRSEASVRDMVEEAVRTSGRVDVLVKTVAPGPADVERNTEILSPEAREQLRREIPLGRFAAPEDISAVVLFLAGEGARHITGATIDVNGGYVMV